MLATALCAHPPAAGGVAGAFGACGCAASAGRAQEPPYAELEETFKRRLDLGAAAPAGALDRAPAPLRVCLLQVFSLAGAQVCELRVGPSALVIKVKRRIARACKIPAGEQRLVFAGELMHDDATLEQCGLAGDAIDPADASPELRPMAVQCIRMGQSHLAQCLEGLAGDADPDIAVEASLGVVADTVLRAEHALSERTRARGLTDLGRAIRPLHRSELISWAIQAFDVLRFDESLLHSVVFTLDRFYATRTGYIEVGQIQKILLAVVCTEMKLAGADDFPPGHWQRVLAHLSHGHIELKDILEKEYEVLAGLAYEVDVPTPVTFLRELALAPGTLAQASRQVGPAGSVSSAADPPDLGAASGPGSRAVELALFLLDICLFSPEMLYSRPHCVLAAGALSAALRVVEADPDVRQACSEMRQRAMEDLSLYASHQHCVSEGEALDCEEDLLWFWHSRAIGETDQQFFPVVQAKFSRRIVSQGGMLRPSSARAALKRLHEAKEGGSGGKKPRA